jgi:hypothetical protein
VPAFAGRAVARDADSTTGRNDVLLSVVDRASEADILVVVQAETVIGIVDVTAA